MADDLRLKYVDAIVWDTPPDFPKSGIDGIDSSIRYSIVSGPNHNVDASGDISATYIYRINAADAKEVLQFIKNAKEWR